MYNWENRGYRQTQKGPDVGHELKPEQGRVGHGEDAAPSGSLHQALRVAAWILE